MQASKEPGPALARSRLGALRPSAEGELEAQEDRLTCSMRTLKVVLIPVLVAAVACSGETSVNQCLEELAERQDRAAARAVIEADGIADTIEGALDIQKESGLDDGNIRLLRHAQQRARDLQADLESSFGTGCE